MVLPRRTPQNANPNPNPDAWRLAGGVQLVTHGMEVAEPPWGDGTWRSQGPVVQLPHGHAAYGAGPVDPAERVVRVPADDARRAFPAVGW